MLRTIELLRPYEVPGVFRQRVPFVGSDGGYVVPIRQCVESDVFYCLGIGGHAPFEEALCRDLPHKTFRLFDRDEPGQRWWHGLPNVGFFRQEFGPGGASLQECVARLGDGGKRLTLKLDIEGAEWDLFERIDDRLLDQIEVIVGEFHELEREYEQERYQAVFRRLNARFTLIHLHGNNYGGEFPLSGLEGLVFPRTLELTYLNHRHVASRSLSRERFPTAIDYPNNPHAPDYEIRFPAETAAPAAPLHRARVAIDLALPDGRLRSYSEEVPSGFRALADGQRRA